MQGRGIARASHMLMPKTRIERPDGRRARRLVAAGIVGLVAALGGMLWLVYDRSRAEAEARAALAAGRLDDARSAIERWIARRPGAGEPYFLLAKLEVARDRPGPA